MSGSPDSLLHDLKMSLFQPRAAKMDGRDYSGRSTDCVVVEKQAVSAETGGNVGTQYGQSRNVPESGRLSAEFHHR